LGRRSLHKSRTPDPLGYFPRGKENRGSDLKKILKTQKSSTLEQPKGGRHLSKKKCWGQERVPEKAARERRGGKKKWKKKGHPIDGTLITIPRKNQKREKLRKG